MKFFSNSKSEKLIKTLAKAKVNFQFDQYGGKERLLTTISTVRQEKTQPTASRTIFRFSLGTAAVLIIFSGTLVASADSQPGDMLFGLNKFREKTILLLPLSVESNAEIQAKIVESRMKALDNIPVVEPTREQEAQSMTPNTRKVQTLTEAGKSLDQAVTNIQKTREMLEEQGRLEQAEKLEQVLLDIIKLSEQREDIIQKIETDLEKEAEALRELTRQSLTELNKARTKARLQIKIVPEITNP
jgi:hypothetical protein